MPRWNAPASSIPISPPVGLFVAAGFLFLSGVALAVSPPLPECAVSDTLATSNSIVTPIPDNDPTGVSATISVSGVTGRIWDLDLTTAITHTASGNLNVTLTSPSGKVVTITTRNGGNLDNVFNGTLWDDDADPDSQIPYAGNPSIVTQHTYTDLVVATPLTPEEPLAAFIGEDPNGIWTLKIVDAAAGDTGSLNSWSLGFTFIQSPLATTSANFSNSTPVPIPDNNTAGATSTIVVSGAGTILSDVNLTTAITHTFMSDLDMTLTSPAGTVVTIFANVDGSGDDLFNGTTWDDSADPDSQIPYTGNPNIVSDHTYTSTVTATPLTPQEPLGAFIGEDPNGTWTLKVRDGTNLDTGTLNSWSLDLTTVECAVDLAITKTDNATVTSPGLPIVYTIVASNPATVDAVGATVTDVLPAALTSVTWTCVASSGSSCGASGTGNISDTVNLLAGGTATYTVHAVVSLSATGSLSNTATVAPPAGIPDADDSNNSATDTDTLTPACTTSASLSVTNSTGSVIPDNDPAGVTSTIVVSGATGAIWDVDLTTAIAHTSNGDLDITLASPSGKVVTISSGNGGERDNVFNGTRWDDSADPGNQIPYSANPNIVTQHEYSNLVVATPLTPEEPLAAFFGDDPNGTWTLKIVDHSVSNTGTLNNWGLDFILVTPSPATAPPATFSNSTPVPIPDNNPAGATSTIVVSGAGTILSDVNLTTAITHTFMSDLDMTLTSPAGTVVTIFANEGGSLDNIFNGTTWDDSADPDSQIPYAGNPNIVSDHTYSVTATPLTPQEPLGAFIGEDPNGTWTLKVRDGTNLDAGTLNSWSLDLTTVDCPTDLAVTKTDHVTSASPGQAVVYTIVASNPSAVAVTGATVGDTFPGTLTSVTWTCVASSGSSCGASGSGNILDTVNLLAGGTATYTVHATISPSASGSLSNTATVAVPIGITDSNASNNSATDMDTLTVLSADVEISKIGPSAVGMGGNFVYGITVTNNGPDAAQNVVLSDTLPAGTTYVSQTQLSGPSFTLGGTPSSITDTIATLGSGVSATFQIVVAISGPATPGTSFSNTATVSATTPDPVSNNDSSTAVTLVSAAQIPMLSPIGTAGLILCIMAVGLFALRRRP